MVHRQHNNGPAPRSWAYGYAINPSQLAERMDPVERVLEEANALARRESRLWSGRVVVEEQVTHILVVSDDPERDHDFNARLEAALAALDAPFERSAPMAVEDDPASFDPPFTDGTER